VPSQCPARGDTCQESSRKERMGVFWMKCFTITGDWEKYVRHKLVTEVGI